MKLQPAYMAPVGTASSGGAPAAAPVAAPLGSAATSGDIPASDDTTEVQWDSFADDPPGSPTPADMREGQEDEGGEAPPPEPSAPAPAAAPAPAPAPAAPVVQAPPTAPAAPQPPAATAPSAEEQARQATEARIRMRDELASIYSGEMDEDTKAALIADPVAVMPRLLSQAAMDGANLAIRHIQETMPQYIAQVASTRESASKAWGDFNAAHPDLAKPEYRQAVQTAIQAVKASGQKPANQEEAMAAVARTTRAMLGLPAPDAPVVQSPAAAPVAPHTPVARGRARPSAPAKANENPWADF